MLLRLFFLLCCSKKSLFFLENVTMNTPCVLPSIISARSWCVNSSNWTKNYSLILQNCFKMPSELSDIRPDIRPGHGCQNLACFYNLL